MHSKIAEKQQQQINEIYNQMTIKKKKQNPLFQSFQQLMPIIRFSLGLEAGDLCLKEVIDNAYVLVGLTKAGKSTTTHILLDDSLRGKMLDGTLIVQSTTNKYAHVKMGTTIGLSQTEIPNIVRVQSKKKQKLYIADTPGYGDSKGVLKVLSNGYYHYRLFSKVKNMKFILTFENASLMNTAIGFINTIKQFTQFFKNYSQKKEQIWQSCLFLITKVTEAPEVALQNIIQRLKSLRIQNMMANQVSQFKQFIDFIIKEKRIMTIKQIQEHEKPQFKGTLDQIDTKITKWWSRKQKNGLVDLEPVAFQLGKRVQQEIIKSPKSLLQFKELILYYDIIGRQFVNGSQNLAKHQINKQKSGSIGKVLQELVKDAMGNSDSHIFLDKMNTYVQDNYCLFDKSYSQVRQNYQKQLFGESDKKNNESQTQNLSISLKKDNKKNYAIKKFKALQNIERIKDNFTNQLSQRSIDYVNKSQSAIVEIIKEFAKICYKKKNITNIIYKYGYSIHRIIEQTKVFMLLIYNTADSKLKASLINQTNNKSFEITVQLRDFFGPAYNYTQQILVSPPSQQSAAVYKAGNQYDQISYKKLHQLYVRSFSIDSLDIQIVNQPFVIFFTSILIKDYQIVKKQTKIVLKYAESVIRDIQNHLDIDINQKKRLINRLIPSRINCQNLIHECDSQEQQQEKKIYTMMLINLTQALGKILFNINKFQYARQVYQSIKQIDQIDQIYQKQIHLNPKNIAIRIEHAKFLLQHFRQEQSIRLLQKACQFVSSLDELNNLKQQIIQSKIKITNKSVSKQYQDFLFDKKDYYDFKEEFQEKLKKQFKTK